MWGMKTARRKSKLPVRVYRSNPVDDLWRAKIRSIMVRRGISQAELARRIGAAPPTIVLLFKPSTIQSTLVAPIHAALGLEPPPVSTPVIEITPAQTHQEAPAEQVA